MGQDDTAARRFVDALGRRDFAAVERQLAPDVRFRGLTPPALREADTAGGASEWLRTWFADATEFAVVASSVESFSDRLRISYRIEVVEDDEPSVMEQQGYCTIQDGRITSLDLVCSGNRPRERLAGAVHRFDAGNLGCTEGLSQEFRRRITAIPVGDVLQIVARDPSAKSDLPSLARMMGHRVAAVEDVGDGVLHITVERGK